MNDSDPKLIIQLLEKIFILTQYSYFNILAISGKNMESGNDIQFYNSLPTCFRYYEHNRFIYNYYYLEQVFDADHYKNYFKEKTYYKFFFHEIKTNDICTSARQAKNSITNKVILNNDSAVLIINSFDKILSYISTHIYMQDYIVFSRNNYNHVDKGVIQKDTTVNEANRLVTNKIFFVYGLKEVEYISIINNLEDSNKQLENRYMSDNSLFEVDKDVNIEDKTFILKKIKALDNNVNDCNNNTQ
jgi:hypothetical protein